MNGRAFEPCPVPFLKPSMSNYALREGLRKLLTAKKIQSLNVNIEDNLKIAFAKILFIPHRRQP